MTEFPNQSLLSLEKKLKMLCTENLLEKGLYCFSILVLDSLIQEDIILNNTLSDIY